MIAFIFGLPGSIKPISNTVTSVLAGLWTSIAIPPGSF